MRIFLLRHGRALHNVAADLEGDSAYHDPRWRDAQITSEAMQDAKKILSTLPVKPTIFYSSPLIRCIITCAAVLHENRDQKIQVDSRIIEQMHKGHVCNHPSYGPTRNVLLMGINEVVETNTSPLPEEGETIDQVKIRVHNWLKDLKRLYHPSSVILAVTHHETIQAITGKSLRNLEWIEIPSL